MPKVNSVHRELGVPKIALLAQYIKADRGAWGRRRYEGGEYGYNRREKPRAAFPRGGLAAFEGFNLKRSSRCRSAVDAAGRHI
jgi:hypothetical protein